jgi:hypothetical protein
VEAYSVVDVYDPILDNLVIDGGEVISLKLRPRFTPRKIFWYSFLLEAEGYSTAGRIR